MEDKKLAIKRRPKDEDKIEIANGEKIKLYLEAKNVPEGKNMRVIGWHFNYQNRSGGKEMETVLVEAPNCFCGEPLDVKLTTLTNDIPLSLSKDWLTGFERRSISRTFYPRCNPRFVSARLCFPSKGYRISYKNDNDRIFYPMRRVEEGYIEFHIEGCNGQELTVTIQYKHGKFTSSCIIKRNYAYIPFHLEYAFEGEDEVDFLHYLIWSPRSIDKTIDYFQLKIYKHKNWEEEEIMEHNQVVVVGHEIKIADNNFHPCKFTKAELRVLEPNKNIIVTLKDIFTDFLENTFGWNWRTLSDKEYKNSLVYTEADGNKDLSFCMLGSEVPKSLVILVENFETKANQCISTPKHLQKVYLDSIPYDISSGECKIDMTYPYITGSIPFLPFVYFFPTRNPIKRNLRIASCRRTLLIPINIYPDIQWFLGLKFKIAEGISNTDKFGKLFSLKALKPSIKKIEDTFEIGIVATWNDKKDKSSIFVRPFSGIPAKEINGKELLAEFLKGKLYTILLDLFRTMQDIITLMSLFKQAVELADSTTDFQINLKRREFMKFSLIPPDIELGISWRAGVYKSNPGFIIEGVGKGTIVGLKLSFDLFCLASKMPNLKAAVLALELIEWATDIEFVFSLEIEGKFLWNGKLGYDESQNATKGKLAIGGKISVTVSLCAKVEPGKNYMAITRDKKEYGVKGTTGITGDFVMELEKNEGEELGVYSYLISNFSSLEVTFYSKTSVKVIGKGKDLPDETIITDENTKTIKTITLIKEFEIGRTDKKRII